MKNEKLCCISLNGFIRISTGWLYSLAPGHKPRFIDEIVEGMITRFKRDAQQIGDDFFYHEINPLIIRVFVEDILIGIPQFRDLNLSNHEYGLGVGVDDPSRPAIALISRYDSIPEEHDFMDLDACIGNIERDLYRMCTIDTKCCKNCVHYNAETKGCKRNPSVEKWEEEDFCSYMDEGDKE